ncbi:MAG: hypothetical protein M3Q72_01305 [Actinomycetota bacterium]|nr:hypothetical protein [Actinomycetota bacterium]
MHVFVVVAGGGLAAVLTFGFAQWCGDLVDAGRARSAADAAALAGVAGGQSRASSVAAANSARIESFHVVRAGGGSTVTVTVRVGDATSTARASDR